MSTLIGGSEILRGMGKGITEASFALPLILPGDIAISSRQEPIPTPARLPRHKVIKVQHYWLEVTAMKRPMQVRARPAPYGPVDGST